MTTIEYSGSDQAMGEDDGIYQPDVETQTNKKNVHEHMLPRMNEGSLTDFVPVQPINVQQFIAS